MADTIFTTEESGAKVTNNLSLLSRYLREVPILRWLFIPNLIFSIAGTGLYQVFLWLSGEFAECSEGKPCEVIIPYAAYEVSLSLSILFVLAIIVILLRITQWVAFECLGQIGAISLFKRMVNGLSGVRTTFFDEYPSGKIINRIVGDFDRLKWLGPIRVGDSCNSVIELAVAACVVWIASPIAALVVFPTFGGFLFIQRNIAPMIQRVALLRSARFGEVLHRETDVIEGARAFVIYGHAQELFRRLREAVFKFMQMHFLRGGIDAWGRFWCDISVALYGFLTLSAVVIAIHRNTLSTVVGAVVVTSVFRLNSLFGWLTWSIGQLFETVGQSRRVFEYVDLPPEEKEEGTILKTVPYISATAPDLELVEYSMSYREATPLILRDISLKIPYRSKVGLVGRTGAGKSSFLQAIFRMVYVHQGAIFVGGKSIFEMPVNESRKSFGVVPQDPYLFEGTIRSNLDRYNERKDEELVACMQAAQLSIPLDYSLIEGGSNLSLGERQLVCLARIIMSKRPIIIMDEPTSGVDTITDAIIQKILHTALADRTVITIAHRLETLSRVERIIEIKDGGISRDGTPAEIISSLTKEDVA